MGGSRETVETMYPTQVIHRAVSLHKLLCLIALLAISGCGVNTIVINGSYPSPLVRKLPITVGVYYPEELRNFSYTEIDDYSGQDQYILQSGGSQLALFNTVLPALCTGCDLCVPPCPMDCIAMVPVTPPRAWTHADADASRARFLRHAH